MAVIIGVSSLLYTNSLVKTLAAEEQVRVELWAEATRQLANTNLEDKDFGFLLQVLQNNKTVPVILTDNEGNIVSYKNLDSVKAGDETYLRHQLDIMKEQNDSILIDLGGDDRNYIYYKNSIILTKLTWYPLIQMGVILLFILVSYFAFSASRKAEQNKVWVGLSKETAHQLGTPTSSMLAWIELLKGRNAVPDILPEMEKDVKRLEKITERFSKVGSIPKIKPVSLEPVLNNTFEYLRPRSSGKVRFELNLPDQLSPVPLNVSLFEWVLENICKNALDAMEGEGVIKISVKENAAVFTIDISDTGKGIPKSKQKTIFKPGYTTKERGWGLGLSLTKRIVEEYHHGKIFVHNSDINKGTTFRILLNKA
jgi:hypothetical protein